MSHQDLYDYTLEEPSPNNFLTTSPSDMRDINLRRENDEALKAIQRIILIEEDKTMSLDEVLARVLGFYGQFVQYKDPTSRA